MWYVLMCGPISVWREIILLIFNNYTTYLRVSRMRKRATLPKVKAEI